MASSSERGGRIAILLRSVVQRVLSIGGNRIELLAIEAQEERALLLGSFFLALVVVGFGVLGGATLTAAVVVLLWEKSRAGALIVMGVGYLLVAGLIWWRLCVRLGQRRVFEASFDQLRKDRESFEEVFR